PATSDIYTLSLHDALPICYEVDIVVQRGTQHVGIEVKAASSVHEADFRGIKRLRELLGPRFHGGIVLYDGDHVLPFGERLLAVPDRKSTRLNSSHVSISYA